MPRRPPGPAPSGYYGPPVVRLEANVLIDLQQHGATLVKDEPLPAASC